MTSPYDRDAAPPPDPELQVVVVTYSPGDELDRFLDTLAAATRRSFVVVLADNGSTDGAPERAARRPEVRLLRTGGNVGYGTAANVAAADPGPGHGSRWVLVANPDITFEPGSLDVLLDATEAWPKAGAWGPAILTPEGDLYPSARALPSLGRGIGHAVAGSWWPSNPWTAAYRRERGAPQEGPAGWLSGSCLLLRREAFTEVGGFDPGYFMYFEDVDLCDRLGQAGWQSVYVPRAVVEHSGGHATKRTPRPMLRAHHGSAYRYLARRYSGVRYAPLRLVLAVGLLARFLVSLLSRRTAEGAAPTRAAAVLDSSRAGTDRPSSAAD
ncbi:MAG: N-acetylglucosaminyl-diphospho-decaprenol L-rhamnosyltransferase [Frankiaceae bacterium]|nr:N-acetylglucosaminyl-diphospho-decaprenol L-rhamnosyltransferase [Frankiaceae bacterium]